MCWVSSCKSGDVASPTPSGEQRRVPSWDLGGLHASLGSPRCAVEIALNIVAHCGQNVQRPPTHYTHTHRACSARRHRARDAEPMHLSQQLCQGPWRGQRDSARDGLVRHEHEQRQHEEGQHRLKRYQTNRDGRRPLRSPNNCNDGVPQASTIVAKNSGSKMWHDAFGKPLRTTGVTHVETLAN